MKIGIMLRNFAEKGGIVVYEKNLLNSLFTIDQNNKYILLYRSPDDLGHFSNYKNVTEHVIDSIDTFGIEIDKLWWDQVSVPKFAKKEKFDLIFNPKLSIPLLAPCKTVWVMHGAEQFVVSHVFKLSDRIYFNIANRLYAKKASAIITMTHLGARDIVEYMGASAKKIHVINEAYNEQCQILGREQTQRVKEKYSLPEKYILFVGGLTPLKNFGNILKAYKIVRNAYCHKLVVVGFKKWKFSKDLQLINQLGLTDHLIFPGFVQDDEIPAFYNLADLLVMPSLYEGFGIPILEAMACGCPVVTSKVGCSPEVAGGAALLVDPYNPEEIADAIQKILADNNLKDQMINRGLERVKNFGWKKCAEETLALFESLVES